MLSTVIEGVLLFSDDRNTVDYDALGARLFDSARKREATTSPEASVRIARQAKLSRQKPSPYRVPPR